jgi:hypothetical protein
LAGSPFTIPCNDITDELLQKYDPRKSQIITQCNEELFGDLYLFSVGALQKYYDLFKKGSMFKEL